MWKDFGVRPWWYFPLLLGYKDRMLVIGGTTKVSVEVYDISAPENICDFKEPFERYAATGGIIENQIVVWPNCDIPKNAART